MKSIEQSKQNCKILNLPVVMLAAAAVTGCGGSSNVDGLVVDTNVAMLNQSGANEQCDASSLNDVWSDNCNLSQSSAFAVSSYTRGIQRILWCQGYDGGTFTIDEFANGIFAADTDQAVRDFQEASALPVSGVVDSSTWDELRAQLQPIEISTNESGYDSYQISGCEDDGEQFYQRTVVGENSIEFFGWKMAATPGSPDMMSFSTAQL